MGKKENKKVTRLAFMKFEQAFDRLDHKPIWQDRSILTFLEVTSMYKVSNKEAKCRTVVKEKVSYKVIWIILKRFEHMECIEVHGFFLYY